VGDELDGMPDRWDVYHPDYDASGIRSHPRAGPTLRIAGLAPFASAQTTATVSVPVTIEMSPELESMLQTTNDTHHQHNKCSIHTSLHACSARGARRPVGPGRLLARVVRHCAPFGVHMNGEHIML
jgi:hypothetical protein